MNTPTKLVFGALAALHLVLTSWFVLHGDINFSSDIARDFLLLQELDQKKLILIGPRSSTGLFHGPLWLYLQYPAFLIGGGNPVAVGWFWIVLICIFLCLGFYIARKLFTPTTAYLYTLLLSLYMVFHGYKLINPHGAMIVLPLFFYTFVRYWQTSRISMLAIHFLSTTWLIQFQMAIGGPFMLLSVAAVIVRMLQKRNLRHLLAFLVIPIGLVNFIIFDLRHNHLLSGLVFDFFSPTQDGYVFNYLTYLPERAWHALASTEILRVDPGKRNFVLTLFTFTLLVKQIRDRRYLATYLSFFYFYLGYFVLSLINKGPMLYFYLYPVFPLVLLMFASLVTSAWKKIALLIFTLVYMFNLHAALTDTKQSHLIIGRDLYSWKAINSVATSVFSGPEQEFGYFVFAPDAFGYEPKYAMQYLAKATGKKVVANQKKPVTYIIGIPHQYWKTDWWTKTVLHIDRPPDEVRQHPNGYTVEKYFLSKEEVAVPTEPNVDPGIHFR